MHLHRRRTQGFTLIELLVVILVIAILAAVLIPNFTGARQAANNTVSINCARALSQAATATKIAATPTTPYETAAQLSQTELGHPCADPRLTLTTVTTTPTSYEYTVSFPGNATYTVTPDGFQKTH